MKYLCLITAALAFIVSPAFAQFYQYTDRNGNVVITDTPPAGADAREKKVGDGVVYRSTGPEQDHGQQDVPPGSSREEEQPKKDYSRVAVAMYMTDW
jgi:hypothetical protein